VIIMLGGGPYTCGPCPVCGENDFWNDYWCGHCGYTAEPDETGAAATGENADV